MRITVKRSGGFGGTQIEGSVDDAELPDELAQQVAQVVKPERLEAAASADAQPGSADQYTYEVILPDGTVWKLIDAGGDAELMEALEGIVGEVIRRRREGP